jgi:hypothetical protein
MGRTTLGDTPMASQDPDRGKEDKSGLLWLLSEQEQAAAAVGALRGEIQLLATQGVQRSIDALGPERFEALVMAMADYLNTTRILRQEQARQEGQSPGETEPTG